MRQFLVILLAIHFAVHADEMIGKVVALDGQIKAVDASQSERMLSKGSPIYVADTLITLNDSKAQIKFTDGALLNLIPDTEYRIDQYRYRAVREKDEYSAELLKGGFRSLSGSIAKKNPEGVEIKTPTSTIGIRGTIIEARIVSGAVYFGVESGLAVLTNNAGSISIGVGAQTHYAVVASPLSTPEPLIERPQTLERNLFTPPIAGAQIGQTPPAPKAPAQPLHKASAPTGESSPLAPGAPLKVSGGSGGTISAGC